MTRENQLRLLRLAAVASLLLALVNHLLPPKAFAATQLLFDYDFGLVRRGLVGALSGPFLGAEASRGEILALAASVTLAGTLALAAFLWRRLRGDVAGWLLLVLALNSFALASFIGNTGYLDGVLLALTVLALTLPVSRAGLAGRLALVVAGVLVHENMLPYFAVLIGFDLWLRRGDARGLALLPVLAGLGTVAALALWAEPDPERAALIAEHLRTRTAFISDENALDVAGRSIGANFALMAEMRATVKYWAWVLFDGLPLLAMALWLIWLGLRLLGPGAGLSRLALAGAVLAPLSLNVIAFDVVRFGVASVLAGFLALALLLAHVPGARARLAEALSWPHFLLVLVLNANIFTIQVNEGAGHMAQFPWVLIRQLQWFGP